ncbi:MAG: anti-sigma factor [Marinosulfonomonas sp.]|nr:anti-sigma factor [Marinosulfonomonas sp.]
MTQVTTDMLHAFVDGQLDNADMALVKAYLAENPDRAAEVADWAAQNDALRSLFPAPDMPIELPAMPAANTPLRAIAASVAILGVGIALGWMGRGITPQNTDLMVAGLVQEAITAHAVFTADAHRPVEIGANEEDLLIRWLSKRVGEQLAAPDLTANGFDLVGGRLLSVADGPAAQFMYENAAGTRITLFAVRSDNSQMAEFTFKQNGKTNSFYWQDDRLRYAIIGDLPRDELSKLAIRVFEVFS